MTDNHPTACPRCDTPVLHAPGIGDYCPNAGCAARDDMRRDWRERRRAQTTALESLPTRVERLERENERLRTALGKIARRYPADTAENMVRFAKDTLGDGWRDA